MGSRTMIANDFAVGENKSSIFWWVILSGIVLIALGTVAVVYDAKATVASVMLFGSLLVVAGAVQMIHSFQAQKWSTFFLWLLDGVLRATVGTLLVLYPASGAATLTLVLSFYFIAGGIYRAIAASTLRFPSWGWTVFSGLVSIVLGIMLTMQWPESGLWFIGFAVGLDLIVSGWSLLMVASVIKTLMPSRA
jgi:uncharacterized membrane protein HdeD (DUF308 family)